MRPTPDRTGPDPRRAVSLATMSDQDAAELLEAVEAYYEEGRQRHFERARRAKALIAARATATAG
ncbi:hypothetical protein [Caulobacter sp. DWP3-1-3b2]|uniref:hypothetical protein n=1 Tax=Caulobacter sp. DWP3-1-3b2 TaxID=2804643 RepID=UPI003CF769B0